MLEIVQIPVLNDNYVYLIHEPESRQTAVVDPAVYQPVIEALEQRNWKLTYVLNTHHHWDHVGANLELKQLTGCQVVGSASDRHRIPGIDISLDDGDQFDLGHQTARIISTPGHTSGHIVYYFCEGNALFCGDTLFSMGCGRLFEGSAEQMWQSIQKIKALPPETQLYCAHEYTLSNARFALTLEPNNEKLITKVEQAEQLRKENLSTIPSILSEELETNPFLRENSKEIQQMINVENHSPAQIFKKIRQLKDTF